MGAAKKIRDGVFKHVEAELYSYWDSIKELKQLREEIIFSTPFVEGDGGKSNLPGDPTGRKATALLMHRRIQQLEQITKAIRTVYDQLPPEKQRLVQMKYWTSPQIFTWEGIAQKVHISKRQALRWRDEIVHEIAESLGWR
jgi:RinA family phage transcriptional activator